MNSRRTATTTAAPLLDLIERRFDLRLAGDAEHLQDVQKHYRAKRAMLRLEHGEAGVLVQPDYAKAVLISEAARLMLREIDPFPRRKKSKRGNNS